MNITALSLFSGIGGGDLSLEMAGVDVLGMCEKDPFCQEILKKNFPNTPVYGDIKTLDPERFGLIDILLTTFPCQSQSVAGKRLGDKDDRWLWKENLKFIRQNKPIFVIGENVKGMLTKGLREVESDLRGEGYEVRSYVLSAKDIGATHLRERVFVVGYKERRQPTNTTSNGCYGQQGSRRNTQVNDWAEERKNKIECPERRSQIRTLLSTRITESWGTLPDICRMDDGISRKLDKERIKSLGNSVCPKQLYPFIKGCVEVIKKGRC